MFEKKGEKVFSVKGETTFLGLGSVFNGEIHVKSDIRIDSTFIGKIKSESKIIVGNLGVVDGEIYGNELDIYGTVMGNIIVVNNLIIRNGSIIQGKVNAKNLIVESGAILNGDIIIDNKDSKSDVSNLDYRTAVNKSIKGQ